MASRRGQSPTPKRPLALKRADGEPLSRADIQYDVLKAIFSSEILAFTNPYPSSNGDSPERPKLCFRDLYIKAILNSPKATKALKDKMAESTLFSEDFAMLSLLVNVGRINTTMSFFPEMKTAIRTYHPIPALQRTGGNLQDAPRIKHILKMGLLDREQQDAPQTPEQVLSRAKSGQIPSTSVLNLLFVLSTHSSMMSPYFSQRFDFLDVFLRPDLSSASRAQAFLWMCFNYLENPGSANDDYDAEETPNPFSDPTRNTAPSLISLTPEETALENVEPPEEKALAERLVANRDQIVKEQASKELEKEHKAAAEHEDPQLSGDEKSKGKKKAGRSDKPKRAAAVKEKKPAAEKSRKGRLQKEAKGSQESAQGSTPRDDMSVDDDHAASIINVASRRGSTDGLAPAFRILTSTGPERNGHGHASHSHRHRYSPYPKSPEPRNAEVHKSRSFYHSRAFPDRTHLQHAWHVVNTTDPLADSDDERGDEYDRQDYVKRLNVISRITQHRWTEQAPAFQFGITGY